VGGRNQHFALYAATLLEVADASILVFSAGTDGIDGNSLAAGAVVDENTLSRERLGTSADGSGAASNLLADAENALRRFDSGTFLESMDARIVTGPTGNNLRDLRILLADRRS
jgi:hydroxypyruvate reductase